MLKKSKPRDSPLGSSGAYKSTGLTAGENMRDGACKFLKPKSFHFTKTTFRSKKSKPRDSPLGSSGAYKSTGLTAGENMRDGACKFLKPKSFHFPKTPFSKTNELCSKLVNAPFEKTKKCSIPKDLAF